MIVNLVLFTYLAFLAFMLVRIERVYRYRMQLLDWVSTCADGDIDAGRLGQWTWRYDVLRSVPFGRMVLQFWRRLGSFYPNKAFITFGARLLDHVSG